MAIRWDLVPWAVVLDLDLSVSEKSRSNFRRGRFVFEGVSNINFPMEQTRLPNGIWITSDIRAKEAGDPAFLDFEFTSLIPDLDDSNGAVISVAKLIKIRSQRLTAVESLRECSVCNDEEALHFHDREKMGSDKEFVEFLKSYREPTDME